MSSFMGACICHKKHEHFSMDDLNGIEKYSLLMSKRKEDIFTWLMTSEGPWKAPESFLDFKQTDVKNTPMKVSNEDEIRIRTTRSPSSSHVDQNEICRHLSPVNLTLSITTSADINNEPLLNWANGW